MARFMHDWILQTVCVDWEQGIVSAKFETQTGDAVLKASGLYELLIPRGQAWGPSVSVNEVYGPTQEGAGLARFSIEMQTGDLIQIVARSFELPEVLSASFLQNS